MVDKKITFNLGVEKYKMTKRIALEKDTTATELIQEGIDYIIEKYKDLV